MSSSVIHPIRKARHGKRLSMDALARKIGVTKATICKWELGQAYPEPATAFRVSRTLGLPLEKIYASAIAA